ncbi:MAG TPA: hypothetical protein VN437_08940 [Rectinemataceae bacterium]|nr:hypothetical protein [Rectinemataceae bacterium]
MRIRDLAGIVDAEIIQGVYEDAEVSGGYTSDLLSDVMAHAKAREALITIQAHRNTIAVAGLVGASAIILCNGRPVPEDMIEAARDEGIALLRTDFNQYEVSGRLWKATRG